MCRLTIVEFQLLIDDVRDQSTHLCIFRLFEGDQDCLSYEIGHDFVGIEQLLKSGRGRCIPQG